MKKFEISEEIFAFLTAQIFGFYSTQCILTSEHPAHNVYKEISVELLAEYPKEFQKEHQFWIEHNSKIVKKIFPDKFEKVYIDNFKTWMQTMLK